MDGWSQENPKSDQAHAAAIRQKNAMTKIAAKARAIYAKERKKMTIYDKNNPESIKSLFGNIAKKYDRTNTILSLKMHQRWNASLVKHVIVPHQPSSLLDLCCGTGDIAYAYLHQSSKRTNVFMLDFCEEMLTLAKEKADITGILRNHELQFLQADAQSIPLESSSIDCTTISYGIRNVKTPSKCIQEVFRVLKPNGVFGILELTRPNHPFFRFFYNIYLKGILPLVGRLFVSNQEAYRYLCNSIQSFIPPQELTRMMQEAGFRDIQTKSLFGGAATILIGKKH